jgi:hypothetical protein
MTVGVMKNVAGERRLILKAGIEIIAARCDVASRGFARTAIEKAIRG